MFEVSLINKDTGKVHRIDDYPVTIVTADPGYIADQLLRNRNLDKWQILIVELPT
jgi:hypothetical protein